jgi:hypothetical protein
MDKRKSLDQVSNAAFQVALDHMTTFDYTDKHSWEKTVQICSKLLPFRKMFDPNLEFAKAETMVGPYKTTFLICAAAGRRFSQVEFFLSCGSNVNAANMFGDTALYWAVNIQNYDMVKLLTESGADLKFKNNKGVTPLIAAEKTENVPIKEYLKKALLRQSQQT